MNLCQAFRATVERYADAIALQSHDGIQRYTFAQYAARVHRVSAGLSALGVGKGHTVAMLLSNRPEMFICDLAILHCGAVPVSVYTTLSTEQLREVFENAECKTLIVDGDLYDRVASLRQPLNLQTIIVLDGGREGAFTLADVEARGKPDFAPVVDATDDDLATIIYTSGTTGAPKGVEITQRNVFTQMEGLVEALGLGYPDRTLSFLPSAHIADRAACLYSGVISGTQVTTVRDRKDLGAALIAVRPTYLAAVPRVWEKLKAGVEMRIPAMPAPMQKAAVDGLAAGYEKARAEQAYNRGAGPGPSAELLQRFAAADKMVFSMIRGMLGIDQARLLITAAAPIDTEVLEFFAAIGAPLCDVWGMSELAGAGTLNPRTKLRFGTVGVAIKNAEMRLADDNELLIRGPIVMKGYRKQPALTREVIDDDGWLHTGDVASIDGEGYVSIVDRKKELIINAAGKNMSPANIENAIKAASGLIGNVVCVGDRRPFNVALIALDPESTIAWAKGHGITELSAEALAREPHIRDQIEVAVQKGNGRLARVEQIKKYTIIPSFWMPGGDELTPTSKLKRKIVNAKYASAIEEMFATT